MNSAANIAKLRSIVEALQIPISQVAKVGGKSRPYVSRLLHGDERLASGSSDFWRSLESNLGHLIEHRQAQMFEVPVVDANKVSRMAGQIKG